MCHTVSVTLARRIGWAIFSGVGKAQVPEQDLGPGAGQFCLISARGRAPIIQYENFRGKRKPPKKSTSTRLGHRPREARIEFVDRRRSRRGSGERREQAGVFQAYGRLRVILADETALIPCVADFMGHTGGRKAIFLPLNRCPNPDF